MQTIRIGTNEAIQSPPLGQPETPNDLPGAGQTSQKPAPEAVRNTVSTEEAIKATEGSKFTTLSPLTPVSGSGTTFGATPGANAVSFGNLIDAGLAVELMDALLPALLVVLLAAMKMDVSKTELQLTAKEKNTLAPLVKACMDQLFINFNSPFAALGVSMVVIYGAKVAEKGGVRKLEEIIQKREAKKNAPAPIVRMQPKPAESLSKKPDSPTSYTVGQPKVVVPVKRDKTGKQIIDIDKVTWMPTEEMIWEYKRTSKANKGKPEIINILKRRWANEQLARK